MSKLVKIVQINAVHKNRLKRHKSDSYKIALCDEWVNIFLSRGKETSSIV